MFIHRFEVQGFKNFVEPVVLDELGEINVIHGDNNVGKSNLLEAMHLFFQLLSEEMTQGTTLFGKDVLIFEMTKLASTSHVAAQIFNAYKQAPIHLSAVIAIPLERLKETLGASIEFNEAITIGLTLTRIENLLRLDCRRFDIRTARGERVEVGASGRASIARLITRYFLAQSNEFRPTFALIEETRAVKGGDRGGFLVEPIKLRLYDAKTSLDPLRFQRWQLFADLLRTVAPNLGEGAFDIFYDRKEGRTLLIYATRGVRLDAALFGSGVQQIATQLALLLTSDAQVVAVEEPECNLRYALQVRLRDIYRQLVAHPFGPRQLFITSHSPAFETGDHFYAMTLEDGIPRLARRPVAEAPAFTGLDNLPVPPSGEGRRSYVTSDGLVEVPPFVLDALGLPQGGGVFFAVRKDDGHVEMLSHRQFLELGGYPTRDDDTDD